MDLDLLISYVQHFRGSMKVSMSFHEYGNDHKITIYVTALGDEFYATRHGREMTTLSRDASTTLINALKGRVPDAGLGLPTLT
jgi:hypothetical protein